MPAPPLTEPAPLAAPIDAPTPSDSATCAACGEGLTGPYCSGCGERAIRPEDESLAAFLGEQFQEVTSADGRLWRTLKALLVPGRLTADYFAGRRGLYVRPIRIFLVVNVIMLFYMSGSDGSVLKGPLETQYGAMIYGPTALELAEQRAVDWGVSRKAVEVAFDARARALAPTLIIVLIPALALAIGLVLWPLRRSAVVHVVLATHAVAGFMAAVLILMTVLSLGKVVIAVLGVDVGDSIDPVLFPLMVLTLVVYFGVAVRRVYRAPVWASAASGVVLGVLGFAFAFWVYRAVLFAFTFSTLPSKETAPLATGTSGAGSGGEAGATQRPAQRAFRPPAPPWAPRRPPSSCAASWS